MSEGVSPKPNRIFAPKPLFGYFRAEAKVTPRSAARRRNIPRTHFLIAQKVPLQLTDGCLDK